MKKLSISILVLFVGLGLIGCQGGDDSSGDDAPQDSYIVVTSPNGGESWEAGSTHNITWDFFGDIGDEVRIQLHRDGSYGSEIDLLVPSSGSYSWTIPSYLAASPNYKISIRHPTGYYFWDESDSEFSISSDDGVTIIKNSVSENGFVTFIDDSTKEDVRIFLEDKDSSPLSGIKVQFWDSKNYELFIAEDQNDKYLSAFEVYPHNSDHWITMSLLEDENSVQMEEIEFVSEKGKAIENILSDSAVEKVYHGRFTPDEIDRVDGMHLKILNAVGYGFTEFFKFASRSQEFSDIVGKIFGTEYEEPEFYDMYTLVPSSMITSTIYWLEPVINEEICGDGLDNDGDGLVDEGCPFSGTRFVDMGNGTVLDNDSGLIWFKDASLSFNTWDTINGRTTWGDAMNEVSKLSNGEHKLTDGSMDGDWRLPTKEEWVAFVDTDYRNPALSNAARNGRWTEGDAFVGVQLSQYWSISENGSDIAWVMDMSNGNRAYSNKSSVKYIWPVRDAR